MLRIVGGITGVLVLVIVATWLFAPEAREITSVNYSPLPSPEWPIPSDTADAVRADAFRRAQVRADRPATVSLDDLASEPLRCRYAYDEPSGTSSKFNCVLESGHVIKVKYGRNPEVHAETAASAVLTTLGHAADHVSIVPRLRCHGCPRYPFLAQSARMPADNPRPPVPWGDVPGRADQRGRTGTAGAASRRAAR